MQAVFRDIFDDEALVLRDDLTAADVENWDSLTHINLIVGIERQFKVRFTTAEVSSLKDGRGPEVPDTNQAGWRRLSYTDFSFLVFLAVVAGLFRLCPKRQRSLFLLTASYLFYLTWSARAAILLAAVTVFAFAVGIGIGHQPQ